MSYSVEILADSSYMKKRLTTLCVEMPRFILAEFNTHRVFSRNSASSRAIPVEKRIAMLMSDPFIPEAFEMNKRGMQGGDVLDPIAQARAKQIWLEAMAAAIKHAKDLAGIGVHKQWANRIIEPYAWHKVIVSSTEWKNFLRLRKHRTAQPEIRVLANMMEEALNGNKPELLEPGDWHLPMIGEEDYAMAMKPEIDYLWLAKLSVARCARVSYLTHDRQVIDREADVSLHNTLLTDGHMSPFEHQAMVLDWDEIPSKQFGNFSPPFWQYRKQIPGEAIFGGDDE